MYDFRLSNNCSHEVSETIEIQGISPNFFSDLTYVSNGTLTHVVVSEFSATDGLTNFNASVDGITNFAFSNDNTQIIFGTYPVDSGMNFPDPNLAYVPLKVYSCTYTTRLSDCPKCQRTRLVHDINFDQTKKLYTIQGREKVVQQILKILMTLPNAHLYDVNYSCTLSDLIGKKIDPYLAAKLQQSIQDAVQHLIELQNTQDLPPNEQILSISSITAKKSSEDPRLIKIEVIVTTADYARVSTSVSLRI